MRVPLGSGLHNTSVRHLLRADGGSRGGGGGRGSPFIFNPASAKKAEGQAVAAAAAAARMWSAGGPPRMVLRVGVLRLGVWWAVAAERL